MTKIINHRREAHKTNLVSQCAVAVLLVVTTCTAATAQSVVVNGSFEDPTVVSVDGYVLRSSGAIFGGWTVGGNSIDHIGSFWQSAEGAQSLDLNGANQGSVYQDLATTPGTSYLFSFAMAGNPYGDDAKRMQVNWGGAQVADLTFDQAGTSATGMNWGYHSYLLNAVSSTTRIEFVSLTGTMNGRKGVAAFYGPALDDVKVEAVPLPAAAWLFGSGLLGLIGMARREKRDQ